MAGAHIVHIMGNANLRERTKIFPPAIGDHFLQSKSYKVSNSS